MIENNAAWLYLLFFMYGGYGKNVYLCNFKLYFGIMCKNNRISTLYGILLIVVFAIVAFLVAELSFVKALSFSPLIVGLLLGMVYANTFRSRLPESWVPGLKFCSKQVLRFGIILYGFRLTFQQVVLIGLPAIVVDCIVVCGTLVIGILVGKLLKMDSETTLLTSTGSAICGAAAVLGAEPIVKGEPHKTTVAVTTVVIFGTLSMFLYPLLYRTGVFDLGAKEMALYTGSTLHEVAHVVGAGNAMDADGSMGIADTATITKMIRVILLAPVLLVMSFVLAGKRKTADNAKTKITIPWFAILFLVAIGINSLLQVYMPRDIMSVVGSGINTFDTFLLTMAMTALGADTSFDKFKKAGAKPFYLAAIIYVWLVGGGYLLAKYLVPILM